MCLVGKSNNSVKGRLLFGSKMPYHSAAYVNIGLCMLLCCFLLLLPLLRIVYFCESSHGFVLRARTRLMGKFTVRNCYHTGVIVFGGFLVRVVRFGLGSRLAITLNNHHPPRNQNGAEPQVKQ